MASWLEILLAILATYRLAQLIAFDDGPYHVFDKFRKELGRRAAPEQALQIVGIWTNLAELFTCPYCLGIWFALPFVFLVGFVNVTGFILLWLGIAGGQAVLQGRVENAE